MKKFDFIIGNPPYQVTKGGTKNVDIWPEFVDSANVVSDNVCMIHPGRWLIPKKQMKSTHEKIINSGLIDFDYYPDASKVFKGVAIDGGVTVTIFKKGYQGDIHYRNEGVDSGVYKDENRFFSNRFEEECFDKIHTKIIGNETMSKRVLGNIGSLGGSEYGYSKKTQIDLLKDDDTDMEEPIAIWANNSFGRGTKFEWHYIEKSVLSNVPPILFSSRKVLIDKKGNAIKGNNGGNMINNIPQIVGRYTTASGDVLFVFPNEDTDYDLQLLKSMFMTKTIRFLMSITQKDLYVRGFENIPDYVYFKSLLNGGLFTDDFFYKTFDFSQELIDHIESHVSPKKE